MAFKLVIKFIFAVLLVASPAGGFAAAAEGSPPEIPLEALEPALQPLQVFYRAKVTGISKDETSQSGGKYLIRSQAAELEIVSGEKKGEKIFIEKTDIEGRSTRYQWLKEGEEVIVAQISAAGETSFEVVDKYRLPPLAAIIAVFLLLALLLGRLKGLGSIFGLALSIGILAKFIIPGIMQGHNPFLVTLAGTFAIAITTIYLAHGFSKRTTIAVASTLITLAVSIGLSFLFVSSAKLFGAGSEEAYYLQSTFGASLNLQGLLLAGIIIGTLGVLDDITTSQVAAVDEIWKANRALSKKELYDRGLSVGREHIASLINTLVLAYAGAGLPLFLLFTLGSRQPWWVIINSEFIAEEIIRTLVGSISLILAVPLSTWIAAACLRSKNRPL